MDVPTPNTHFPSTDTGGLSKDKVETLRRLISRLDTPATASSFAHTRNLAIALNASATHSDYPWFIDFGASDHDYMCPLFPSYNPCSSKEKVIIVDGSLSPLLGKGFISLGPSDLVLCSSCT
jgi:hypothetical protein